MATTLAAKLTANEITSLVATDAFPLLGDPGGTPNPGMARLSSLTAYLATATLAAGVLTASAPMTLTQTWNAGGVTFRGKENVFTITAAAAGSTVERWLGGAAGTTVLGSLSSVGALSLANGTVVLPAFSFVAGPSTGLFYSSVGPAQNGLAFAKDELFIALLNENGLSLRTQSGINWTGSGPTDAINLSLVQDAANTLALRNGTAAQTDNLYDTWASATDYHRVARKTARATLSGVTGASVTATGLIPAGAVLIGVTTKVTTGLGTVNGTTGYNVGDGTDADRWGAIVGTVAGTSSAGVNATADPAGTWAAAARNVVVTAVGGNFDGTGVIYLSAQYDISEAD